MASAKQDKRKPGQIGDRGNAPGQSPAWAISTYDMKKIQHNDRCLENEKMLTVVIVTSIYWTGSYKCVENYETEKLYEVSMIKFKGNVITRGNSFCVHRGIDSY